MSTVRNILTTLITTPGGWAILILLSLPVMCSQMSKNKAKKDAVEKAEEMAYEKQSCQIERSISEEESIARCENAATLFGKDISADPSELAICVQQRESTLRRCDKMGL